MQDNVPDKVMLTTVDNPFSPFTQFKAWYAYDLQLGHHTSALLARVANYSDDLSEPDQDAVVEAAIDEIVAINPNGKFRKVRQSDTLGEHMR